MSNSKIKQSEKNSDPKVMAHSKFKSQLWRRDVKPKGYHETPTSYGDSFEDIKEDFSSRIDDTIDELRRKIPRIKECIEELKEVKEHLDRLDLNLEKEPLDDIDIPLAHGFNLNLKENTNPYR